MTYLNKEFDWQKPEIARMYNELPLWSARFGLLLLEQLPMTPCERALDIGFGTGFPLLELAQRLGPNCQVYGVDPWKAAVDFTSERRAIFEIDNVEIRFGDAAKMDFPDNYFQLITSNLGINNFEQPEQVIAECYRILQNDGTLCITSNLTGTFQEFYDLFDSALIEQGLDHLRPKLQQHIEHRGTVDSFQKQMQKAGFNITKIIERPTYMRYTDGSAFLNHAFIVLGFIAPWKKILPENQHNYFFEFLENKLNEYAKDNGEFRLSIPMLYMECRK